MDYESLYIYVHKVMKILLGSSLGFTHHNKYIILIIIIVKLIKNLGHIMFVNMCKILFTMYEKYIFFFRIFQTSINVLYAINLRMFKKECFEQTLLKKRRQKKFYWTNFEKKKIVLKIFMAHKLCDRIDDIN